jgi:Phasin protein
MRKQRLKPPANDTRPTRRSLVELTEAASRAAGDGMLVMPSSVVMITPPRAEELAHMSAAPKVAEPAAARSSSSAAHPASDDTTGMLVQIAKDQHAQTLDSVRLGVDAMLDLTKDLARTPTPTDPRRYDGKSDNKLRAAAAAYRSEVIDLAKANVATTLDYARGLAGATTSADLVELSGTLARRHCELMFKQAAALQSLARGLMKPGGPSKKRLTPD